MLVGVAGWVSRCGWVVLHVDGCEDGYGWIDVEN